MGGDMHVQCLHFKTSCLITSELSLSQFQPILSHSCVAVLRPSPLWEFDPNNRA